ncbi:hypothetical protein CPC16_007381 [Podila verticillata]|nr:hypothetical protein CPC16_007381 [Podila verticillata]
MTLEDTAQSETASRLSMTSPFILIAGAGIGGLTTALRCERAGIKYFVFGRATNTQYDQAETGVPGAGRKKRGRPYRFYRTIIATYHTEFIATAVSIDGPVLDEPCEYLLFLRYAATLSSRGVGD